MESGRYTDLAFSIVLVLSLILGMGLLINAFARWLRARSLWNEVMAREALNDQRVWSRVKIWSVPRKHLFAHPIYAMMYADQEKIRIEAGQPITDQPMMKFDRLNTASHWRCDSVEFKLPDSCIRIKAIGAWIPISSIQQTDAFWRQIQPKTAEPFENGARKIDSCADRRSKIALLTLGLVVLFALTEIVLLDTFWLISAEPFAKIWWIPVFAALPVSIWMIRDLVPPVEAGATALILAVGFAMAGHFGLKRVDQWISNAESQLFVLRVNGDRELVPLHDAGPVINLRAANPVWNEIALGSQHAVTVYGGVLGTSQVDYDQLLPNAQ